MFKNVFNKNRSPKRIVSIVFNYSDNSKIYEYMHNKYNHGTVSFGYAEAIRDKNGTYDVYICDHTPGLSINKKWLQTDQTLEQAQNLLQDFEEGFKTYVNMDNGIFNKRRQQTKKHYSRAKRHNLGN